MTIQVKNKERAVFYSQDNVFSCNMANLGGAVDIVDNFQRVNEFIFKNTNFTNNTALTGGAILGFNTKVKVVSSSLLLNKANLGGSCCTHHQLPHVRTQCFATEQFRGAERWSYLLNCLLQDTPQEERVCVD